MIEPTQILLFAVVIILTLLLLIIGWKIYQILIEVHKSLTKINRLVDNTVSVTSTISKSVQNFTGVSEGVKLISAIVKLFKKEGKGKKHE